jgi:hypothetical protein
MNNAFPSNFSSQKLTKTDVLVLFVDAIDSDLMKETIQEFLASVRTNTHLMKKEIYFITSNWTDFVLAWQFTLTTPTGTPINKRLIYVTELEPDWTVIQKGLKRDQRIFVLTSNLRVWLAFWGQVLNLTIQERFNKTYTSN